MSQKGLYKKTIGAGWDHDPDSQRPRESRFFEKAESGKVEKKSKSKAKGKPRADHKHVYEPVCVWKKSAYSKKISSSVKEYCPVCGRQSAKSTYAWFYKTEHKYLGKLKHFFEDENGNLTPIDEKTYRKTIFLGGGASIQPLSVRVKNEWIHLLNCGHKMIISDNMGADLQLQNLLFESGYENVVVYYSGDRPRINLGNWQTKYVPVNQYVAGEKLQKQTREKMTEDCDEGFVFMQGESVKTLAIIRGFVENQKLCRVVSCTSSWRVETEQDIEWLLQRKADK